MRAASSLYAAALAADLPARASRDDPHRYTFSADRLEAETAALAQGAARAGGRGARSFGPIAALLFEAIRSTPNAELVRLDYRADGSLAASLQVDNPATLAALRARAEASGLGSKPARRSAGGRDRRIDGAAAMNDISRSGGGERSSREQRLLLVMAALLALLLGWLLVDPPARRRARRAPASAMARRWSRSPRRKPAPAPAGGVSASATPPLPLDAFVARSANEAGFAGARIDGARAGARRARHRRGAAAGLVRLDRAARGAGRRGRDAARPRQCRPHVAVEAALRARSAP